MYHVIPKNDQKEWSTARDFTEFIKNEYSKNIVRNFKQKLKTELVKRISRISLLSGTNLQRPNLPVHRMLMTAVSIYIRGQILELPVIKLLFYQTLAPLCDPNPTFEHLRQMMSPL